MNKKLLIMIFAIACTVSAYGQTLGLVRPVRLANFCAPSGDPDKDVFSFPYSSSLFNVQRHPSDQDLNPNVLAADSNNIYVGCESESIAIIDRKTFATYLIHLAAITSAKISPIVSIATAGTNQLLVGMFDGLVLRLQINSRFRALVQTSGTIDLTDRKDTNLVSSIVLGNNIISGLQYNREGNPFAYFAADSKYVYSTSGGEPMEAEIDTALGKIFTALPSFQSYAPGSTLIHDMKTGAFIGALQNASLGLGDKAPASLFSDGEYLLRTFPGLYGQGILVSRVADLPGGNPNFIQLPSASVVGTIATTSGRKLIIAATRSGTICLFDPLTNQLLQQIDLYRLLGAQNTDRFQFVGGQLGSTAPFSQLEYSTDLEGQAIRVLGNMAYVLVRSRFSPDPGDYGPALLAFQLR